MNIDDLVPLGTFEEQILVAVLRTPGEAYGMQVRREIERVTGRDLAIGAVYATLDRLEAKGLVASGRALAAATAALVAVGVLSAWLPAHRASRTDPVIVLREQ